jgi:Glycosyl hydrolase family 26
MSPARKLLHLRSAFRLCAGVAALGALALGMPAPAAASSLMPSKEACVYSAHEISILQQFDDMVGRRINCATVYSNANTTWAQWERPWFINYYGAPNLDWSAWATAPGSSRQLAITLSLIPSVAAQDDWLRRGAAGDYARYARVLAANLVAAGLGDSIIRLAPEMNGTWNIDSLGTTREQWAQWDEFWRRTVEAMRSVPGANFEFDWCIAALYRDLPLSEIYPGNNVVNMIGIDVYDTGNLGTTAAERWNMVYNGVEGIATVLQFARHIGKPISIPEWGIAPVSADGFGDDSTFVNGIARVVRDNPVVYQSYFYKYGEATELASGRAALAAYRRHFGARGDSVDSGGDSWAYRTPVGS